MDWGESGRGADAGNWEEKKATVKETKRERVSFELGFLRAAGYENLLVEG